VQEEKDQQQPEEAQEAAPEAPAAEDAAAEAPAAEDAPSEDVPSEEAPAEEAPAEEAPAEEAPAAPAADAEEPSEPAEQLSPRERRKRARATARSEQRPQRSPDERARERAEQRGQKAQARRRWRQKRKDRDSATRAPGGQQADRPAAATPGTRKSFQGVVVSSKGDKSITVRIDRVGRHRVYGKVVRQSSTLHAHDERNEAGEGDVVRVVEARPLSRTKRWRLVQVLEKAK
jgi:small subunit ribosomal protein S17